jgi:hypothetical protein
MPITGLTALRDELEAMVTCDNKRVSECRIIGKRGVMAAGWDRIVSTSDQMDT